MTIYECFNLPLPVTKFAVIRITVSSKRSKRHYHGHTNFTVKEPTEGVEETPVSVLLCKVKKRRVDEDIAYGNLVRELKSTDKVRNIWNMSSDGTKVLCMGDDFRFVFRQIGEALLELMDHDKCHGNLSSGVYVSNEDQAVKLFKMNLRAGRLTDNLLIEDIEAFQTLVKNTVALHNLPNNVNQPVILDLFYSLCEKAKKQSGSDLRDDAFFVYSNVLFFDPENRVEFFSKVWDYAESNVAVFNTTMDFTIGEMDMSGWETELLKPEFRELNEVYFHKNSAMLPTYRRAVGIVYFHRHSYVHYADKFEARFWCRIRVLNTDKILLQAAPDFFPKFFLWCSYKTQ